MCVFKRVSFSVLNQRNLGCFFIKIIFLPLPLNYFRGGKIEVYKSIFYATKGEKMNEKLCKVGKATWDILLKVQLMTD